MSVGHGHSSNNASRRAWALFSALALVLTTLVTSLLLVTAPAAQATPTECANLDILAHRGYHYRSIAENTTRAFDEAAARGYSIETDVWADAQGQLWIFHDRNPLRATGVSGFIDQMTTAQVSALRYKKGGAPLPTFQQALAQWQTFADTRIFIEPKNLVTVQSMAPLVQASGIESRIWYTAQTNYINNNFPASKTMARSYSSVPAPSVWVAQGIDEVMFGNDVLTTQDVDSYHAAGILTQLKTSNVSGDWREAIRLGMDTILTDMPDELKAFCPTALLPPTISSFTPGTGSPGTEVTITGTNFSDVSQVKFNTTNAAAFTVVSPTTITATVPGNVSGATQIHVLNPNGDGVSTTDFVIPLQIDSFTPTTGQRGATVVITGAGFTGADQVRFGTADATTFTVDSSTQISAVVPAGAPASGKIVVHAPAGTVTSVDFFKIPPVISSFTPTSGPAGTSVVLTGSGFTGATGVKFGTVAAAFTVNSDTQITATAPSGVPASANLSVISPGGTGVSSGTYGSPVPAISGFTPATGPVGTVVTISGTKFIGATSVQFGTVAVSSFTVDSDSQITATVPPGVPASSKIKVTGPGGSGTSTTTFVVAAPTMSGFTPPSGPAGTVVTVNGTNFTGATLVQFGTVNASSFTVVSNTQITAVVPAGVVRSKIRVTTPGGSVLSVDLFSAPVPTITSFTPSSGPAGTEVVITGTSFTGATLVKVGALNAASYTVDSDTQIRATVPSGLTAPGKIRVTTPVGSVLSATNFTPA